MFPVVKSCSSYVCLYSTDNSSTLSLVSECFGPHIYKKISHADHIKFCQQSFTCYLQFHQNLHVFMALTLEHNVGSFTGSQSFTHTDVANF